MQVEISLLITPIRNFFSRLRQVKMAEALSLNPPSPPSFHLLSLPNTFHRFPSISFIKPNSHTNLFCFRRTHPPLISCLSSPTIQPLKPYQSLEFSGSSLKPLGFSLHKKFGFSVNAEKEEGGTERVADEAEEEARGQSTMPERFRYLTKEAPDRPVRWPWLIALAFAIYAWRAVLWELSNWKNAVFGIASFFGTLSKLTLALVFHFIGDPVTNLIRCIETALYTVRSIYSSIVASAPVSELTLIITLTSVVIAVAEATVPDSTSSQPYLLTLAGIIGFASVVDFIPELPFWLLLVGLFCFSRFYKKKDAVSSALPPAAVLVAVGQPWVRLLVLISYMALAIVQYSKKLPEGNSKVDDVVSGRKPPLPLVVAALAIGVHVAAKWVRYRHLTWMIA